MKKEIPFNDLHKLRFIDRPTVGKFYLVPCVVGYNEKYELFYDLPILPFPHSDKNFGEVGAKIHIHFDMRFLKEKLYFMDSNNSKCVHNVHSVFEPDGSLKDKFYLEPRKCYRQETGFCGLSPQRLLATQPQAMAWYMSQIGQSCKGKICPHWKKEMIETKEGTWECPYHGLIGDPETEKIISNVHIEHDLKWSIEALREQERGWLIEHLQEQLKDESI